MTVLTRRRAVLGVAVVVAGLVSGCTAPTPNGGPVQTGGPQLVELPVSTTHVENCVDARVGDRILLGSMIGPAIGELTLDKIVPNGLNGLTVLDTVVLDPADGTPYATWNGVPDTETIWKNRVPAPGAALEKRDVRNIVLEARVEQLPANIGNLSIYYQRGNEAASTEDITSFRVAENCA